MTINRETLRRLTESLWRFEQSGAANCAIESLESRLCLSATPLGQAAIDGASGVALDGTLAYVGTSDGIDVVDVSNPQQPNVLSTFGASDLAGDTVVAAQVDNNELVVLATPAPSQGFSLLVYSLANPNSPTLLGQTPLDFNGGTESFLGAMLTIVNSHVFTTSNWYRYSGSQITAQFGESLDVDISNPANPTVVDAIYNDPPTSGTPDGTSQCFQVAQANADTLLIGTTSATGSDVNGPDVVGEVLVVDTTNPSSPTVLEKLQIPGMGIVTGIAVQGSTAIVVGSQQNFLTGSSGLGGDVVVATLDLANPQSPTLVSTQTLDVPSIGLGYLQSLGNGQYTTTSNDDASNTVGLLLVDASNLQNVVATPISVPNPITGQLASGGTLYTTDGSDLNIYDDAALAGTPTPTTTPGSVDPTFNGGQPVPLGFAAQASIANASGQTLLAGLEPGATAGSTQAVLEQLNADGSIDDAFGSAGTVTDSATSDEAFFGVVAESDGTLVAAGISNGDLLLAGYNSDGSADASFGTDGRVTVPIAGASDATIFGVTADASGNLLVAGSAGGQFLADRFTANGVQDPAFNGGAPLLFGAASDGDVLGKVAVQSDGDIVAAGASGGSVVVVRLTPAGALDSSFGNGGIVTLDQLAAPDLLPGQPDYTEGLTIDSEGRILVANTSPGGDFATARLNASGSLDSTFGTGGVVTTSLGGTDDADFVAVQPDDSQIIVAGASTTGGVVQEAIAAYTPAGMLDTTFGNAGEELLSVNLSAAPALALKPPRLFLPQAQGSGSIVEDVFGTLEGGKLELGAGRQTPTAGAGAVQRFLAPAPTATPLPVGTLGASVSASVPAAVVGGAKAKASVLVTVTNPTSQTLSGPATVTVYVSLGQSLGGATQLLAVRPRLKLKPHAHTALRFKLSSFPSLPAGSYYLVASVDAPDGTTTGAAGPALTISPAFVKVTVSGVNPQPAAVAPGKKASLALTLQDQGNVLAMGTADVKITASTASTGAGGTTIATVPLKVKLKQGAAGHYKVKFAVPADLPAGRYYLVVKLNVAALGDDIAADGLAVSASTLTVS